MRKGSCGVVLPRDVRAEVVVSEINDQLGRVEEAIQKHIIQHQKTLMQSMGKE